MVDIEALGWDLNTLGELDHQTLKPPYVRLNSHTVGEKGDVVYFYDLRISQPNQNFLSTLVLHSFEHLLIAGFRKYLGENYICVAPMGCQTGFYLVLLNVGEADRVCTVYENILSDILTADVVPYVGVDTCGQAVHHDLEASKELAQKLLSAKAEWRQIL